MASTLRLTSTAFTAAGPLAPRHTCDGEGCSPPLRWSGAPEGTQAFALVVDDPDAPRGLFTHWLVWDIPADATWMKEGEVPQGAVEGANSGGEMGWYPACPPPDDPPHRYFFRLYALDCKLELPPGARRQQVMDALQGHVLATTEVETLYAREAVLT